MHFFHFSSVLKSAVFTHFHYTSDYLHGIISFCHVQNSGIHQGTQLSAALLPVAIIHLLMLQTSGTQLVKVLFFPWVVCLSCCLHGMGLSLYIYIKLFCSEHFLLTPSSFSLLSVTVLNAHALLFPVPPPAQKLYYLTKWGTHSSSNLD